MRSALACCLGWALACAPAAAKKPRPLWGAVTRFEDSVVAFDCPEGFAPRRVSDISADHAVAASAGGLTLTVLVGTQPVAEVDPLQVASRWHTARVRNRVSWGVRAEGGPPAEAFRLGERRVVRYRDRVGSAIGATEQTMTCGLLNGRPFCVVTSGPESSRDRADGLAEAVIGSLRLRLR